LKQNGFQNPSGKANKPIKRTFENDLASGINLAHGVKIMYSILRTKNWFSVKKKIYCVKNFSEI